jgi:hypothetical protein
MPDLDPFERRLAAALRADADMHIGQSEVGTVAGAAIAGTGRRDLRVAHPSSRPAGRSGWSRGIVLLAAATVLLGGGVLVAGSGVLRRATMVPPVQDPAFATVTSPSRSPGSSPSAAPSRSPVTGSTGVWVPTGSMGTARRDPTAVRLLDGRVLVAGGWEGDGTLLASAELYDPDTGTWSATGDMVHPYAGFPATLLRDGRVLVGDVHNPRSRSWNRGAEVYDPDSGTWSSLGKVSAGDGWDGYLSSATATTLHDGRVLVVGRDAKVYDPDSGTWSATGPMIEPHLLHTATLLPDGRVLVAGGIEPRSGDMTYSAELYDPATGSWAATAHTHHDDEPCVFECDGGRDAGRATLLEDGTVLLVRKTPNRAHAETYDPATGTWTQTVDRPASVFLTLTPLLDGTVLAAGGLIGPEPASAEVYDPVKGSWTETASMPDLPVSATLLDDGTVLVAGGTFGASVSTVLLYVPAGLSPPAGVALPSASPAGPG